MEMAPHEAPNARGSIASAEGYLALTLILLSFLAPSVDHPSNQSVIAGSIGAGVALGLALGGARFGKGGGLVAAWLSLLLLGPVLLLIVISGIVRWDQVRWYWGV
jgi:hypothetical protein